MSDGEDPSPVARRPLFVEKYLLNEERRTHHAAHNSLLCSMEHRSSMFRALSGDIRVDRSNIVHRCDNDIDEEMQELQDQR